MDHPPPEKKNRELEIGEFWSNSWGKPECPLSILLTIDVACNANRTAKNQQEKLLTSLPLQFVGFHLGRRQTVRA